MLKLKHGKITYQDLDISIDKPLQDQLFSLKEDLLQISFEAKKIIIDLGWYPEFDINGEFVIKVIRKFNWENPIFEEKTQSIEDVYKILGDLVTKWDD